MDILKERNSWRRTLPLVVCALLVAALASAATTSRLTGTVVDSEGLALPGVTVLLNSEVLIGGQQVAITDSDGSFQFTLLPPGMYSVRAELTGFRPADVEARVALDRDTQVRLTLIDQEFTGEIEVTAETPVIDVTRVSQGESYNESFLKNASVGSAGRDYLSVIGNEAGSVGTGNVRVFGGVSSDNVYLVDGLNTTDPVTATFGTNFNFDAIQEVSIQTGGYDAEFGQALGGVINLVTKSGGNEFSGAFDARYQDEGFAESGDHFDPDAQDSQFQQYSASLGGPISRDKVWFFASYEYNKTDTTPTGADLTRSFDGSNWIGKVTWQAGAANRIIFKASGDPAEVENGNYFALGVLAFVEPEAAEFQEQGGEIYQVEVNSVLSDSMLLTAQAGINRQELNSYPVSGDLDTPAHYNLSTGIYSINANNAQFSERDSDQYKAALTYFVDELAGSHEFKGGAEFRKLNFSGNNYYTGDRWFWFFDAGGSSADVNGDGLLDTLLYNDDPGFRNKVESEGDLWTAYVQDVWRPAANWTVRLGARWDSAAYDNQFGTTVADFDSIQPRLGIAWDVLGDGKNVIRVNAGRFMHPASVNLADTVSGQALSREIYYGYEYLCAIGVSCDTDELDAIFGPGREFTNSNGDTGLWYFLQDIGGDPFESVQTLGVGDMKAQYADQFMVAYERQLWDQTSLELQYVNKQTRNLFEDTCRNNTWAWGDGTPPSLDNPGSWTDPNACTGFVLLNLDGLKRDYEGYIAKFETRYENWYLLANYTYSTSEGNTESTASRSYAAGFYDEYPRDFYNTYGRLGDDRRHRFKLNGYWLLPWDFTLGFNFFYSSEAALDYQANCSAIPDSDPNQQYCNGGAGTLLLEPRGSRRAPNDRYEFDLQVSKGFQLGAVRLEGIVAVQNLFSSEQGLTYQENEYASVPWGTITSYSQPRRYEFGVRIEF